MSHTFTWSRDGSTEVGGTVIDWDEDCLVSYSVFGKYVPAKTNAPMEDCYPAEYPEITIESIIDSQGEDVVEQLIGREEEYVQQAAEDNYDELDEPDYDEDAAFERHRQRELDDKHN